METKTKNGGILETIKGALIAKATLMRGLISVAIMSGAIACGDMKSNQVESLSFEDNAIGTVDNALGDHLPGFLNAYRPNGAYRWQQYTLASKNGQTIHLYSIALDGNEHRYPMLERATTRLVSVRADNNQVLTVNDNVGGWNYSGLCNSVQCTSTVTMEKVDTFSTDTEKFSVGLGINVVSVDATDGTRNRSGSEQATDECLFNQKMLDYAQSQLGNRVGNGECWTLADEALKASGAHAASSYYLGSTIATNSLQGAKPGDMLQMDQLQSWQGWSLGGPQHTSIIKSIDGDTITVYEQNAPVGGATTINTYDFSTITSGTYYVFRAAPKLEDKDATCTVANACAAHEIVDCNGNCAPAQWLGDGYCDDGTYSYSGHRIDLSCSAYNSDNNDCSSIQHCEPKSPGISQSVCDVNNCNLSLCYAW